MYTRWEEQEGNVANYDKSSYTYFSFSEAKNLKRFEKSHSITGLNALEKEKILEKKAKQNLILSRLRHVVAVLLLKIRRSFNNVLSSWRKTLQWWEHPKKERLQWWMKAPLSKYEKTLNSFKVNISLISNSHPTATIEDDDNFSILQSGKDC